MDLEFSLGNIEQPLAGIEPNGPENHRNIMTNCDDFINRFKLATEVKQLVSLLEKARRYYLNEKKMLEMDVLFSVYCKIKSGNLSNEDLRATTLSNYITGNSLTLEGIEHRLSGLGWKG